MLGSSTLSRRETRVGTRFTSLLIFSFLTLLLVVEHKQIPQSNNEGLQARERRRIGEDVEFQDYKILSSQQIFNRLRNMERLYPKFLTLHSSQEKYGLPAAGNEGDCPFDHDENITEGCKNYIITIEDQRAHPSGSYSWKHLPEVFLSGALHGDERVGPTAVVELADLLLQAASCEAKPHGTEPKLVDESRSDWLLMMEKGRACRKDLYTKGIDDVSRKWLARLVTTRRIVIMPSPNALGYFRNQRSEFQIDPNRDFPYDLNDQTLCMQTIAGRSINEVFRDHMFQLSLTFHGGMEVISYEWGAPSYLYFLSPDDTAQKEISAGYSRFAGKFGDTPSYATGTMNAMVYPVRGGMEDWAYAGSWDLGHVNQCKPKTFGGYAVEKTTYNNSTLRALNMLVETSNIKIPKSQLGSSQDIFNDVDYQGNGHIARNMRLSLLAIDLVQPYVSIVGVNRVLLSNDMSLATDNAKYQREMKTVAIPKGQNNTIIKWTVGGGFTVDETTIFYIKWDNLPEAMNLEEASDEEMRGFTYAPVASGTTQWHGDGANPVPDAALYENEPAAAAKSPTFSVKIDTSDYDVGDHIAFFAMAKVDQGWSINDDSVSPHVPPTSHVVNARTNPEWFHKSANKIIKGKNKFFSTPLTLIIMDPKEQSETKDLSNRFESFGNSSFSSSALLSSVPSNMPSDMPSFTTSLTPSISPSAKPSSEPSVIIVPSKSPSSSPSSVPSVLPSYVPSDMPSAIPSLTPSLPPSAYPSMTPSSGPSAIPSTAPSAANYWGKFTRKWERGDDIGEGDVRFWYLTIAVGAFVSVIICVIVFKRRRYHADKVDEGFSDDEGINLIT